MTTTLDRAQQPAMRAPIEPLPRRRQLRICHVSMSLATGGLERLLVELARFHDPSEFELQFAALDQIGPPAEEIRRLGCAVHALDLNRVGKRGLLRKMTDLFQRESIDIVHTHNTYAHYYGARGARRSGVPRIVNTQHGRGCGRGWKARLQFLLANLRTDRIVGVSDDATALCRTQDPLSRGKTQRIWNGVDLSRFAWHGPQSSPVAISVSRLSPEKDVATLLDAVHRALQEAPDLRLIVVGDGVERPALEAQSRRLGIEGQVEFLGERSDVAHLLTQAAFFVSSSRTEGVSLTLLEAMAVGLPVLTTRVGGNPEVVEEGVTGRLVPSQDPAALAAGLVAMCQAIDDGGESLRQMGRAGRERAMRYFDIRQMVAAYENLYRELAGR